MTPPTVQQPSKDEEITDETAKQQDAGVTTIAKNNSSLPNVPENYFFHSRVHIEEGDIVIVFMVCIRCARFLAYLPSMLNMSSSIPDERVSAGYHCYERSDVP